MRNWSPDSLILALQYWEGDEQRAMELARLLADIERERRGDVVLALCRSATCSDTEARKAAEYCHRTFPAVMLLQSTRAGKGHPDGPNQQWASFMEQLCVERAAGRLRADSVCTLDAGDGVPLSADWIDRLIATHRYTLDQGYFITASVMPAIANCPSYPNGNLIMYLPWFENHPGLLRTPPDVNWDLHHAKTLLPATRASELIANHYDSGGWTGAELQELAKTSAWLHGFRDDAPWAFAKSLAPAGPVLASTAQAALKHSSSTACGKPAPSPRPPMKIYACFTPSHRPLLERHFLPSLPPEYGFNPSSAAVLARALPSPATRMVWDGEGLALAVLPQRSESGAFRSKGFQATCLEKVEFILEALAREKDPFLFSDVDVRFYGPVADDLLACLGDADMAFQWDGAIGHECTGFMVLRPCPKVLRFWQDVRAAMVSYSLMDQDAAHLILDGGDPPKIVHLPERYWTYGRDFVDGCKLWEPWTPVKPPAYMLMHHGNWTVGISNKLALLEAVKAAHSCGCETTVIPRGTRVEPDTLLCRPDLLTDARRLAKAGPMRLQIPVQAPYPVALDMTATIHQRNDDLDEARRLIAEQAHIRTVAENETDYLMLILSFWQDGAKGDKDRAMELARLLADIETRRRDDTYLVFARQKITPMDSAIRETMRYCERVFNVVDFEAEVDSTKIYPGIAYDPWISALQWFSDGYFANRHPAPNAMFIEADGNPLRTTWLDDIRTEHQHTLRLGKLITGPQMHFGGHHHTNGTAALNTFVLPEHPGLLRCRTELAWDVFFGPILLRETGPSRAIRCDYRAADITPKAFVSFGQEACWYASCRDRSALEIAKELLVGGSR